MRLLIRLTPSSSRDKFDRCEVDALGETRLRLSVTAIPEKGKANAALVKYLSKKWRLPKTTFSIISGETSRNKVLKIEGDPTALKSLIEADLAANGFYKI